MSLNNSTIGFTFQKLICDKFNVTPISSRANKYFNTNYEPKLKIYCDDIIDSIFNELNKKVKECVSFCEDTSGNIIPYNFVLENRETLSIRTNIAGKKVSPRELGQAGYNTLTKYFSGIFGSPIKNKSDIKSLFINFIDIILPIYIDKLFDADYLVWIFQKNNNFEYIIIEKNKYDEFLLFDKKDLTFTRNLEDWSNSNTLKYKGKSIAEIQIFENRGLIFRFFINNLIKIL